MRTRTAFVITLLAMLAVSQQAVAQYNESAGKSAPMDRVERTVKDKDGVMGKQVFESKPRADRWGNAQGNQHDLAVDGAFEGQTVAVIQLYTLDFDFSLPRAALKEKGFSTYRWSNVPPSPSELEKALEKSSQLWIISGERQQLTAEHLRVIKKFFDAGHGVYIWGDNQPYYADANFVAEGLLGASMHGDLFADQTVGLKSSATTSGLLPDHLLTTGLEHIYEGITIATIKPAPGMKPLIYGSAGNLVTAYYDQDGRRAILDGGFTRLYMKWDTAGTARYVKNAASWLVNAERFGDAVVSTKVKGLTPVKTVPSFATPPATKIVPPPSSSAPAGTDSFLATGLIGLLLVGAMLVCFVLIYVPSARRGE